MTIYKLAIGTNGQVTSREKVLFVPSKTGKANWQYNMERMKALYFDMPLVK